MNEIREKVVRRISVLKIKLQELETELVQVKSKENNIVNEGVKIQGAIREFEFLLNSD